MSGFFGVVVSVLGYLLLGCGVMVIVATAGVVVWDFWSRGKKRKSGR